MTLKLKTSIAAAALSVSAAAAHANTIVDIAVGDDRFSTLVAAVTAAGLAETLSGPGPFTVYAQSMMPLRRCPSVQLIRCSNLKTNSNSLMCFCTMSMTVNLPQI